MVIYTSSYGTPHLSSALRLGGRRNGVEWLRVCTSMCLADLAFSFFGKSFLSLVEYAHSRPRGLCELEYSCVSNMEGKPLLLPYVSLS